ncbi:retrovirus-related pol polyprotein from transposon TNT 1-94 [Tanacetum coccineum]
MFFYLTTLNLTRFLNETAPQVEPPTEGQPSNAQAVQATTTAKELWESLERKYKTKDAVTKKFMHKRKEMSAEDLIVRLRIEEDNKLAQKNTYAPDSAKANMMPKWVNPRQANMVNDNVDMIVMVSDIIAMISEVNLSMFHSFRAVDNGEKRYMGNSATADIKGEGDVILKMTFEKELKLTNVLYVLEIHKNLMGYAVNGMFKLNVMVVKNDINKMNSSAYLIESSNVWHGRLGHVNFNSMRRLIKFNSIPNFHIDSKYKCETCVEAKLTRSSFKSVKRKTKPLDMIHTDICDLKSLPTKGGNKYFITFIDDCTKYCYVYLLKSKDEAIDKFVLYKTEVENQLGRKIKVVRSDRGGEYVSPFAELCAKHGIRHEFTAPYLPQQNGIAERKNRTLKEMVIAMLISSGMSQDMWGEAILTATYLLNKIPPKVAVPTPKAQKIGPKYIDCIFIGYAKNNTAYRFIVHELKNPDIQKNTVMESRNASFFEHIFPCLSKETESSARLDDEVVQDKRQRDDNDLQDERQDQTEEEEVEPRRSKKARNEKLFGPDFVSFMVENEPKSYREAKKMKADGTIDKYKARLVIKGYRQREGLDYFDTYSPVTRITSIRMILAIAALRNLEIHQMDVKMTFLNGDLEEEIYMNQPEGFIAPGQEVKDTSSGYVILCLYVDDMLIVGSNDKMIGYTKDMLKSKFDMKDMGLADVILRIKIIRTQNGLVLSQAHYVDKIHNTHNAGDFGQTRTSIDTSTRPGLSIFRSRLVVAIMDCIMTDICSALALEEISFPCLGSVVTFQSQTVLYSAVKHSPLAWSSLFFSSPLLDKCEKRPGMAILNSLEDIQGA